MRCQHVTLPYFKACGLPAELYVDRKGRAGRRPMRLCDLHAARWDAIRKATAEEAVLLEVMLR